MISQNILNTIKLRTFGFFKVPLLFLVSPSVKELTETRCVIKIPLCWRTKNHLGCMYFGVLCMGGDMAGGLIAMHVNMQNKNRVNLIIKDFQVEFLRRAEGDVYFICNEGVQLKELVLKAIASGEREELKVQVIASEGIEKNSQVVAKMHLTVSLKRKKETGTTLS